MCEVILEQIFSSFLSRSASLFVVVKNSFPEIQGFLNLPVINYRVTFFVHDLGS